MTMFKLTAWVKETPNKEPIATCETRSFTVAETIRKALRREGFRVDLVELINET